MYAPDVMPMNRLLQSPRTFNPSNEAGTGAANGGSLTIRLERPKRLIAG